MLDEGYDSPTLMLWLQTTGPCPCVVDRGGHCSDQRYAHGFECVLPDIKSQGFYRLEVKLCALTSALIPRMSYFIVLMSIANIDQ